MYGDFWYLESKSQPDSCLQPKTGFCGLSSHRADEARCESPMAIKGSKNSKKCKGDNINLGVSPQFYNPSKIRSDNLDTSSKSIIHQKPAACTPAFWYLDSKSQTDSCLQPKAGFCGWNSLHAEQAWSESPMAILRVKLASCWTSTMRIAYGDKRF